MEQYISVDTATELDFSSELRKLQLRRTVYPAALVAIYSALFLYLSITDSWSIYAEQWQITLTMTLGSFIAGATAEGGGAVAFPVFTKVLHIPPKEAAAFGLMIQSVGMTMASLLIITRKINILPKVILFVSAGGLLGQLLGQFVYSVPAPYSRILFTFVAAFFGIALAISHWKLELTKNRDLPSWKTKDKLYFLLIGIFGGVFAATTGCGIDMLTFVVLTLLYGMDVKISTPTTVVIMAINSIVGATLLGVSPQEIGIVWDYWIAAIPVVILGAPLGAWVCSKIGPDQLVLGLLFLITVELVSTILIVPISPFAWALTAIAAVVSALWFNLMIRTSKNT